MIDHCYRIISLRREIETRQREVNSLKVKATAVMKEKQKALPYREPILLVSFVDKQEELLKEEKTVVEKRRQTILRAAKVIESGMAFNTTFDMKFIEAYESYNADRQNLQMLERKLKLRQHKMCRQLLHIFPFRRVRSNITEDINSSYHKFSTSTPNSQLCMF